jgi:hypothetical protein
MSPMDLLLNFCLSVSEKGIYNIISRFKGTDLNNEEIKAYVGERNSNLKTDELDSISKKALDLMIEDKREEEKPVK